jgi:hypothetical protein
MLAEAWRERFELLAESDVQAVGEERNKDVRFDTVLFLVEDGADGQIAFECFEGYWWSPEREAASATVQARRLASAGLGALVGHRQITHYSE